METPLMKTENSKALDNKDKNTNANNRGNKRRTIKYRMMLMPKIIRRRMNIMKSIIMKQVVKIRKRITYEPRKEQKQKEE